MFVSQFEKFFLLYYKTVLSLSNEIMVPGGRLVLSSVSDWSGMVRLKMRFSCDLPNVA